MPAKAGIQAVHVDSHLKVLISSSPTSAATGEFKPETSDIDFLVEFDPNHEMGPWLSEYFGLKDELEHLFGRKVDLVMIGALRNPYFIEQVNCSRTLLYAA